MRDTYFHARPLVPWFVVFSVVRIGRDSQTILFSHALTTCKRLLMHSGFGYTPMTASSLIE